MKRRRNARDQELADNACLLRAWRRWHAEQLEQVLAGPHGAAVARILKFLEGMRPQSTPALIALLHEFDWHRMDAPVRLVVLHEINEVIVKLRERFGMLPIDAAPPHDRSISFLLIRELFRTARGSAAGRVIPVASPDACNSG
jgi:hypothetical protein